MESLRRSLRTWFTFYDGFTPDFSWWVRKPHEAADKALEDYAKFLREEVAGQHGKDEDPLVGDPVGEQGLTRLLAGELIAYTPQEIVKIGERELGWCEAEIRKAAGEMGFSENWKAALAKVKSSFVPPGQQDELIGAAGEGHHPVRQGSRPAHRPAALRGDLAIDDDLAGAAEVHAVRGLRRPADDRRLRQRVDEA